jgi:3-methylfumaryl-CoA hydratase
MFAGARLTWTRALPSDAPLQRIAEVGVPVAKDGRAGPMAFVTVRFRYLADGVEIAQEEQDLVYLPERKREEVAAGGSNEAQAAATGQEADGGEVPLASVTAVFDTPALFRFSALTYNSHRIHYDEPYVTGEEGYPGLVVHGPLLAIMLADLVRGLHGDDALVGFTFKARAPAFVGESLTFEARPADTQVNDGGQERAGGLLELTARRGQVPLMTATAQLRPGLV